jgi:hypothetical protein
MSAATYTLTAIATITLVACSPSPRYTLHETTDPRDGHQMTVLLNTSTGQASYLGGYKTTNGTWLVWRSIEDFNRAYKLELELKKNEEMLRTNPGAPLYIY